MSSGLEMVLVRPSRLTRSWQMICLRLRKISMPTTPASKETGKMLKMGTRTKTAKTATKKTTMAMPVETMAVDLAIIVLVVITLVVIILVVPAEIMLAVPAATTANLAAITLAVIRMANLASNSISLKREQDSLFFIYIHYHSKLTKCQK